MSDVTNVLLAFSTMECWEEQPCECCAPIESFPLLDQINAWLTTHGYGAFGASANWIAGGRKQLEVHVYAAAFNYLETDAFLTMLRALPWEDPANVQVFLMEERDERFHLVNLFDMAVDELHTKKEFA